MKITFISDTHTQHKKIELPGGDILIFSGDFMGSGYRVYEAQSFLKWFSEQPYKYKIFIAGNHDRYCENNPELFEALVDDYVDQNVIYLKDDIIEVEGLKIYGTPWQPYFCNWAFNISDSDILTSLYQNIPEDLDILITHCPPYNTLDKTHITPAYYDNTVNCGEEPLGSKELETVLSELGEHRPKIHCFGHIHGDGGNIVGLPYLTKPYPGGVCYINASVCDENYNPINKIVTIDYEKV